ncbi:MAG: hypothetical protein KF857_07525 [Fimbriimonadaceae bacterium]|nr:hypothetical protein [Fimbriimonadaceae bacterium]
MQVPTDPYGAQASKSKLWLVGGIIVLVAMVGFGLGAGIFRLGGRGNATLGADARQGPPILAATGAPPPQVLPAEGNTTPVLPADNLMPKDVLDWLKHLEETERRRKALATSQIGPLMADIMRQSVGGGSNPMKSLFGEDGPDVESPPTQGLTESVEKIHSDWQDLDNFFQSVPPPAECAPTQAQYSRSLGETQAMMTELAEAIGKASESPDAALSALKGMQGKSKDRIDAADQACDRLVQQICDKYKTRKWFSIASDIAGGLTTLPGLAN